MTSPGPVLWPRARAEYASRLQVQQVAPSLAPVSQPAGGISGGPSPNAGTQVPDEILAFLISANFYADDISEPLSRYLHVFLDQYYRYTYTY